MRPPDNKKGPAARTMEPREQARAWKVRTGPALVKACPVQAQIYFQFLKVLKFLRIFADAVSGVLRP